MVVVSEPDGVGTVIEVWADTSNPRLGGGTLDDDDGGGALELALMRQCEILRASDGTETLMTVGAQCADVLVDGRYDVDVCDAALWMSSDGFAWSTHPQTNLMADDDLAYTSAITNSSAGWIIAARPKDGGDDTLWLATTSELMLIPISDTFAFNDLSINHIAATDKRVLIATDTEIFAADLDYLLERTLSE